MVVPSRLECRFLYREIFIDRAYLGGVVPRGATVVDAGAHVGLFALWATRELDPTRLLLFEPIPPVFAALERNCRRCMPRAECHQLGLSGEPGPQRFRYYPRAAGWSSALDRDHLLRESLLVYLQRARLSRLQSCFAALGTVSPRLQRVIYDLVCDRILATGEDIECSVETLSRVIDEHQVDRIGLLKLDVEGAELEVLRGVRDDHWPRLGAIAAEVEDVDGRLDRVRELLTQRGMVVHHRQAPELAGTAFHLVWADRPAASGSRA
jgi:FkbM family methyltransferase